MIRLLDPIRQLTQDGAASLDRLIEYRKECKLVWDQLVQAHDELIQVHPEDGDPDAVEFGSLEMRKAELMGTLAEVITRLNTERLNREQRAKDDQAQKGRDEERERQHQVKLDQVVARRLRLANLYAQAKEQLTRLLRDMSLEEVPSPADLMTCEQELINARVTSCSANKLSLALAELDTDLATEVLEEDARETSAFNKLEKEILLLINKHNSTAGALILPLLTQQGE